MPEHSEARLLSRRLFLLSATATLAGCGLTPSPSAPVVESPPSVPVSIPITQKSKTANDAVVWTMADRVLRAYMTLKTQPGYFPVLPEKMSHIYFQDHFERLFDGRGGNALHKLAIDTQQDPCVRAAVMAEKIMEIDNSWAVGIYPARHFFFMVDAMIDDIDSSLDKAGRKYVLDVLVPYYSSFLRKEVEILFSMALDSSDTNRLMRERYDSFLKVVDDAIKWRHFAAHSHPHAAF